MRAPLLLVAIAFAAFASSPGMVEGPPGCSWIVKVQSWMEGKNPVAYVKLIREYGSCTATPCRAGPVGAVMDVPAPKSGPLPKVGEEVKIWISPTGPASFDIPACTTRPMPRPPG